MKFITLIATASLAAPLAAQDAAVKPAAAPAAPAPEAAAPALTPEQKAVADQANAYAAAYNKGDAKALVAMFADDAEWVEDQLSGDYALNKLASYLDRGDLSLRSARQVFRETFLGA